MWNNTDDLRRNDLQVGLKWNVSFWRPLEEDRDHGPESAADGNERVETKKKILLGVPVYIHPFSVTSKVVFLMLNVIINSKYAL